MCGRLTTLPRSGRRGPGSAGPADVPVHGRRVAGLADLGVQAQVGDELAGLSNRVKSPTAATIEIAVSASTRGMVISRATTGSPSASTASSLLRLQRHLILEFLGANG